MKSFLIAIVLFSCTVPRQQDSSATANAELLKKIEMQNRQIEQLLAQDAQKQQAINELTQRANDPDATDEERGLARTERKNLLHQMWDKANEMGLVDRGLDFAVSRLEEYLDNNAGDRDRGDIP